MDVTFAPPACLISLLAAAPPDAWAWHAPDGDRTFGEAYERVETLAKSLFALAVPDGVIAILGENSGRYIECLYAIPHAGCQALLLNYRHHPTEWVAMLQRTAASVVIGDTELLRQLASAAKVAELTIVMIAFEPDADSQPDCIDYETIVQSSSSAPHAGTQSTATTRPDSTAWLVPTSGTTGTPKLAMLTHRSLQVAAHGCHLARPVAADDIYLFPFPLCHVAAYNVIVYHQFARPIVLVQRFDVREVVQMIEQHRVTAASLAPTMIASLLDAPDVLKGRDISSLHTIGYGSSGIAEPLLRRAMDTLQCGFSQGYGMTELSGNAVFLDASDHARGVSDAPQRLRQAGRPTAPVEVRIVDDAGVAVGPDIVGEIAVRGEQVMAGYFNDPEATSEAIVDGWLHTGDLGTISSDGYLSVVDRKKDIIISGGENVASREVEGVLYTHPAVREAAVIGIPDERWGEIVAAVIAVKAGHAVTAEDLMRHCRNQLAGFKQPRHIEFLDELPKNTTGKIEKHRLRKHLANP